MIISKTFRFEASHVIPNHPGKCSRLHGHSWVLTVLVKGDMNPQTGMVMDYYTISEVVKPIIEGLDHHHLNDLLFLPTSENLLWWIAAMSYGLKWHKLTLNETCTSSASLSRKEYNRGLPQRHEEREERRQEEAQERQEIAQAKPVPITAIHDPQPLTLESLAAEWEPINDDDIPF